MIFALFAFFIGSVRFTVCDPVAAAEIFMRNCGYVHGFHIEDRKAVFFCLSFRKRRVLALLREHNVKPETVLPLGLPRFLASYRTRVGLILGIAVWISITCASEMFFWRIQVVGNVSITDSEILSGLSGYGITEGAFIPGKNVTDIANRYIRDHDNVAWMAINVIGNCAEVVVVEFTEKEKRDRLPPSNIVASGEGVITSVEVFSGVAEVGVGETVTKGQLLISGVSESRSGRIDLTRADGRILAEVVKEIAVDIPFTLKEKVPSGEIFEKKSFIFFTKRIKLYKSTFNLPPDCDRIETVERIMLFGKIPLPLWSSSEVYTAYTESEKPLTEEEARARAEKELNEALAQLDIVSYESRVICSEVGITLVCTVHCIEDIAAEIPLLSDKS